MLPSNNSHSTAVTFTDDSMRTDSSQASRSPSSSPESPSKDIGIMNGFLEFSVSFLSNTLSTGSEFQSSLLAASTEEIESRPSISARTSYSSCCSTCNAVTSTTSTSTVFSASSAASLGTNGSRSPSPMLYRSNVPCIPTLDPKRSGLCLSANPKLANRPSLTADDFYVHAFGREALLRRQEPAPITIDRPNSALSHRELSPSSMSPLGIGSSLPSSRTPPPTQRRSNPQKVRMCSMRYPGTPPPGTFKSVKSPKTSSRVQRLEQEVARDAVEQATSEIVLGSSPRLATLGSAHDPMPPSLEPTDESSGDSSSPPTTPDMNSAGTENPEVEGDATLMMTPTQNRDDQSVLPHVSLSESPPPPSSFHSRPVSMPSQRIIVPTSPSPRPQSPPPTFISARPRPRPRPQSNPAHTLIDPFAHLQLDHDFEPEHELPMSLTDFRKKSSERLRRRGVLRGKVGRNDGDGEGGRKMPLFIGRGDVTLCAGMPTDGLEAEGWERICSMRERRGGGWRGGAEIVRR